MAIIPSASHMCSGTTDRHQPTPFHWPWPATISPPNQLLQLEGRCVCQRQPQCTRPILPTENCVFMSVSCHLFFRTRTMRGKTAAPLGHPPLSEMVLEAVAAVARFDKGASHIGIAKYLAARYPAACPVSGHATFKADLHAALKSAVTAGSVVQTKKSFQLTSVANNSRPPRRTTRICSARSTAAEQPKAERTVTRRPETSRVAAHP